MKFGVADYGLNVWDGACFDTEARLLRLKEIGYDGLERLQAESASAALEKAARFRRLGMDFGTCLGPTPETSIRWTAALGKTYVWAVSNAKDQETYFRQLNCQMEICRAWGLTAAVHNHLGTLVENQEQLETMLRRCPNVGLILDTAHLAAAGGDPMKIIGQYPHRLAAVHLKDWLVTKPELGLDRWPERGRFCELGAGNIGLDNVAVLRLLKKIGFDGWVFVEQDTHLRDPYADLAASLKLLQEA